MPRTERTIYGRDVDLTDSKKVVFVGHPVAKWGAKRVARSGECLPFSLPKGNELIKPVIISICRKHSMLTNSLQADLILQELSKIKDLEFLVCLDPESSTKKMKKRLKLDNAWMDMKLTVFTLARTDEWKALKEWFRTVATTLGKKVESVSKEPLRSVAKSLRNEAEIHLEEPAKRPRLVSVSSDFTDGVCVDLLQKIRVATSIQELKEVIIGETLDTCLTHLERAPRKVGAQNWDAFSVKWVNAFLDGNTEWVPEYHKVKKALFHLLHKLCDLCLAGARRDNSVAAARVCTEEHAYAVDRIREKFIRENILCEAVPERGVDRYKNKIKRILAVCLPMDRARSLYSLPNSNGGYGWHWYAEIHTDEMRIKRAISDSCLDEHSMNRRYLWLISALRLEEPLKKWIEPALSPSLVRADLTYNGVHTSIDAPTGTDVHTGNGVLHDTHLTGNGVLPDDHVTYNPYIGVYHGNVVHNRNGDYPRDEVVPDKHLTGNGVVLTYNAFNGDHTDNGFHNANGVNTGNIVVTDKDFTDDSDLTCNGVRTDNNADFLDLDGRDGQELMNFLLCDDLDA
jgi:hypothetical protein